MYFLEREQVIAVPRQEVFDFFSDPANLARLTPPSLRFRIHGAAPRPLFEGARIEYRIRWLRLSLAWVTRITRWSPPEEFRDVQERGPYALWRHTHLFEAEGEATRIRDRVEYALPAGPLGRLAHALLVRRQLEHIFDYRQQAVTEIFGGRSAPDARLSTGS